MYEDFVLGLRSIGLGIILGLFILAIQAIVIQFIHKKDIEDRTEEKVKIIRCRDCKHFYSTIKRHECRNCHGLKNPNLYDFCSRGESLYK